MKFTQFISEQFGTTSQFARQMGVSLPAARQWLKTPGMMKRRTIYKLAEITKIDVCQIIRMK